MSTSITVIRDGVVSLINGLTLTPITSATAIYDQVASAGVLAGLAGKGRLCVFPTRKVIDELTRGAATHEEHYLDIALQCVLPSGQLFTTSYLDPYLIELEGISDSLLRQTITVGSPAVKAICENIEHPVILNPTDLEKWRVFTAYIKTMWDVRA